MTAMVGRVQRWRLLEMATLGVALGLSACAFFTDEKGPPPPPVVEAPPAPSATVAPPRPARKPPPPALSPGATDETVDPEHLIGLDEEAAADWLGEPNQRNEAPPARIWRYLSKDCQIEVYF